MRTNKHLVLVFILTFVSCCKSHDETVGPKLLWSVDLPRFDSPGVLWQGERIMPIYSDIIVAHTTMHDDWDEPWTIADNRLCGINLITKSVEWLYPKTEAISMDIVFNHIGYSCGRLFVVKYLETNENGDVRSYYTSTAAVDIVTGEERWRYREQTEEIASFFRGVVGDGNKCYFINDGQRVYMTDIQSGETELLYSAGEMKISNSPFFIENNLMAIIQSSWEDPTYSELVVVNPITKTIIKRTVMPKVKEINDRCIGAINNGNTIYGYIAEYNFAYDIDNEKKLWECWTPGCDNAMDLLLRDGILYKAGDSWTYALDAKTGNPLYDYPELGADRVTIDDGKVYFVASYGTLYIMNLKDGRILSATECPGYGTYFFGSYPTIYDNKLYIMGGTQLHCYKI